LRLDENHLIFANTFEQDRHSTSAVPQLRFDQNHLVMRRRSRKGIWVQADEGRGMGSMPITFASKIPSKMSFTVVRQHKVDQLKLIALIGNAAKRLSLKYSVGMSESETRKFFSCNKIAIDLRDVRLSNILHFDSIIEIPDSNLYIGN
jgi:hypothetical protein